jgi:hypothetical protein
MGLTSGQAEPEGRSLDRIDKQRRLDSAKNCRPGLLAVCRPSAVIDLVFVGVQTAKLRLTAPAPAARFRRGEMSERSKVPDSKSGVPGRVPRVRIPLSPLTKSTLERRGPLAAATRG